MSRVASNGPGSLGGPSGGAESIPGLSPEDRLEIARAAALAERRNRPRALVALSAALLVLAGGSVALGLGARRTASGTLENERRTLGEVRAKVARLEALERAAPEARTPAGAPIPDLISRVERAAQRAGVTQGPLTPNERSEPRGAYTLKLYGYEVTDRSIDALLEWTRGSCAAVPGLEVYSLKLSPVPNAGWSMSVQYSRWEARP